MVELKQYADQWGNFRAGAVAAISGGQFVKAMSSMAAGTKRPDQVLDVDLCDASTDESLCVGIATNNAASGEGVTVATRGMFKTMALGTIAAGKPIACAADSSVQDAVKQAQLMGLGSAVEISLDSEFSIGKALNDAVSGEKIFINLNVGGF